MLVYLLDMYGELPYSAEQHQGERTMVVATPQKQERLEARITHEQKELLQRAAALEGTTVTDFVVRSVQQAAERAIHDHAELALNSRESVAFVEALLNPPTPNQALRAAAKYYRQVVTSA
jgi:uncharacterized protein (DUF1778 family)